MNAREIFKRQPPTSLFHYTNQSGLLGIINDSEIWATHTQYLNDAREFRHAIDLIKDELAKMMLEPFYCDHAELLRFMKDALVGIETINVCVCSFSAKGDVLSQWRAYGGRSSGFAVGFSGPFLKQVCKQLNFWLVPVQYSELAQRSLLRTLLEDVFEENLAASRKLGNGRKQGDGDEEPDFRTGGNLVAYLNRYAPILKHESFSEEEEWRIITRPLSCAFDRFAYRTGTSMLVPYYRIPLTSEANGIKINELIVGPTPHPIESRQSVGGFLVKHRLDETEVRNSQVPYRNW